MDLIVIKYYIGSAVVGEGVVPAWAVVKPGEGKNGEMKARFFPVPRWCAKEVIRQHRLTMVYKDEDGHIYDTPNLEFLCKWKGKLTIPAGSEIGLYEAPVNPIDERRKFARMFDIVL